MLLQQPYIASIGVTLRASGAVYCCVPAMLYSHYTASQLNETDGDLFCHKEVLITASTRNMTREELAYMYILASKAYNIICLCLA